eukprot:4242822-Lingulodinium_polyedra.AAC.1
MHTPVQTQLHQLSVAAPQLNAPAVEPGEFHLDAQPYPPKRGSHGFKPSNDLACLNGERVILSRDDGDVGDAESAELLEKESQALTLPWLSQIGLVDSSLSGTTGPG